MHTEHFKVEVSALGLPACLWITKSSMLRVSSVEQEEHRAFFCAEQTCRGIKE